MGYFYYALAVSSDRQFYSLDENQAFSVPVEEDKKPEKYYKKKKEKTSFVKSITWIFQINMELILCTIA